MESKEFKPTYNIIEVPTVFGPLPALLVLLLCFLSLSSKLDDILYAVILGAMTIPTIYFGFRKIKRTLLKRILFSDDIVFQYRFRPPVRYPFAGGVKIDGSQFIFGETIVDINYFSNMAACSALVNEYVNNGLLPAETIPQEGKHAKTGVASALLALLFILGVFGPPILFYAFYDRLPVHLVGVKTDSLLLVFVLLGSIVGVLALVHRMKSNKSKH